MKTNITRITSLILTTAAAALLTACGSTSGYKQADKTGEGIAEFRAEIANGKKAIDDTLKALDAIALSATTDPRKAFDQYAKAVSNLESVADKAKKRGTEMQAQGQAYFQQWEKQMAEVQNPEIRKLAGERKAKLQETFTSTCSRPLPLSKPSNSARVLRSSRSKSPKGVARRLSRLKRSGAKDGYAPTSSSIPVPDQHSSLVDGDWARLGPSRDAG